MPSSICSDGVPRFRIAAPAARCFVCGKLLPRLWDMQTIAIYPGSPPRLAHLGCVPVTIRGDVQTPTA
jgi:hypothetical protein